MSHLLAYIQKHAIWGILLIGVFPFVSIVSSPFVSDDWEFLYHAETLPYTADRIFGTNTNGHTLGGSYRPVVNLYWGTMYQLFGLNPVPYHLVNMALFACAIWLLYRIVRRLPLGVDEIQGQWLALLAAALFAVFPGRVEAVAWISVINDTLLVVLLLASWLAYITALSTKKWYWYVSAVLSMAAALGTKETAVTFPAILAGTYLLWHVQELYVFRRIVWHISRLCLHMLPYAIVLGLFFYFRFQVIGLVTQDYTGSGGITLLQNDPVRAYLSMVVASLIGDTWRTSLTALLYMHQRWIGVVLLYIMGMLVVLGTRQTFIRVLVLCLWYLLALFPASRFGVNVWQHDVWSAEGERYTYYPSIFLAILLATVIVRCCTNRTRGLVVGAMCIVYLSISTGMTVQKVGYWQLAADQSHTLRISFLEIVEQEQYDGVVVVGLPDALYGAFLWRNAFSLALDWEGKLSRTATDVLITEIRTVPYMGMKATVTTTAEGMVYSTGGSAAIVSAPHINTADYVATHVGDHTYHERLSISYTHMTNGILVYPTPAFVETNSMSSIGWLFYDGTTGWIVP